MKKIIYILLLCALHSCNSDDDSMDNQSSDGCNEYTDTTTTSIGPNQGDYIATIQVTDDFVVSDVNITIVNLNHSHLEEVIMTLIAPDGFEVILNPRPAVSEGSYSNAIFDSEVNNPIQPDPQNPTTQNPITGTFSPEESLSTLYGQSSLGQWALKIMDLQDDDAGTLTSWILELCE